MGNPAGVAATPGRSRRRSSRFWLCLAAAASAALPAPGAAAPAVSDTARVLDVGYSAELLSGVDLDDARAATAVWISRVVERTGVKASTDVRIFTDTASMLRSLEAEEVDLLVLSPLQYLEIRTSPLLRAVFISSLGGDVGKSYLLLVRRDGPARQLRDLRGRRLLVHRSGLGQVADRWLDAHLLRLGLPTQAEFFASTQVVERSSQAVLPVLFGQADACLVAVDEYETMCELNPQLHRDLMELDRSPSLPRGPICLRPAVYEELAEVFDESLLSLHSDPEGRQLLALFGVDQLVPFEARYLQSLVDLEADYERLRAGAPASAGPPPSGGGGQVMHPQRTMADRRAERHRPGGRRILWRTAVLSWLVLAITLGLYAYFLMPYQRDLLVQRLQSAAEVAATSVAEVTISSIIVENYGTVVDHCLAVVSDRPAVLYIVVTRRDGFSLIHLKDAWRYATLDGYWVPPPGSGPSGSFRVSDLVGQEVYHYSYPLQYSGIDWGWIHIALSLEEFRAGVAAINRRTAALGLLCALLGLAASMVFARQLTKPLRALSESADRVARGDLSVRTHLRSRDEVQQLAGSFNAMTEALQTARSGLEATVVDRTRELRASEARWRSLVENAPDLILTVDPEGVVQFVSRQTPLFTQGSRLLDSVRPECRDELAGCLQAALSTGAAQTMELRRGLLGRADVSTVFRIGPIVRDGVCEGLIIIATDVTERVRTEERIIHLERLGALGEMAAGVSHNLNNILTGIMGPAELLLRESQEPVAVRWARDIHSASQRAADLVHRLHLSTRGVHDDSLVAVDLNDGVREAVSAARPRWKDEPESRGVPLSVTLQLAPEGLQVRATRSGLYDLVLNLLLNALEAVRQGGSVTVSTVARPDGTVVLQVIDTGVGMDEQTRRRVFEPFFTTRKDVGSGLGLTTCYATVTRWGGTIEVASEVGSGSTFTVRLPAASRGDPQPGGDSAPIASRRGSVLIVDDETATRCLLSQVLADAHDVQVAVDGAEALAKVTASRFDVALVDLGMPAMPGDQLMRVLRQRDPRLVAILVTGWELDPGDPRREPFDYVLQKPFRDLARVRQLVAQAVGLHDERASATACAGGPAGPVSPSGAD
ncbi:MAG: PhnD/SsuA/transferrin family substrate-binding protein [Gemmatimonadota bacterium]